MKRIRKTHPPKEFIDWLKANEDLDCSYAALQGKSAHEALKNQLLKEQGFICAYTGIRITLEQDNFHVEHLKPQTICKEEQPLKKKYLDDVEYHNMVACFPKDGGDTSFGYGAPIKGGWWDEHNFVSPCHPDCENRFLYGWEGEIKFREGDLAAETTIKVLGLAETSLKDKRHGRIRGFFGFGRRSKGKKLSPREAKFLLRTIDRPDTKGHLKEFCFVFKQLLPRYIP